MAKTAFITGASSGIGRALAQELAGRGCDLFLCARRLDALEAVKEEIAAKHPERTVELRQLDVTVLRCVSEPLVMVVNGYGEDLLRLPLADDVFVKNLDDVLRGRNTVTRLHHRGFVFLADDVHA